MRAASYIDDGLTQPGYIQAAPRLHDALRFTFRPTLVRERGDVERLTARGDTRQAEETLVSLVARKLVSWDLCNASGQAVAISTDAVLRLQPELFLRLTRIVLGYVASDVDPLWSDELVAAQSDDMAAASARGQSIGEYREALDEKN